jgi:hypothetical protein
MYWLIAVNSSARSKFNVSTILALPFIFTSLVSIFDDYIFFPAV